APGSCPLSNEGEIFYMLMPDPAGEVNSNVRTKAYVASQTLSTLGHELQHLINADRRLYLAGSASLEETWLNEGLSHIGEELIFFEKTGLATRSNLIVTQLTTGPNASLRVATFNTYANPNFGRLRQWLQAPHNNGPFESDDDLAT